MEWATYPFNLTTILQDGNLSSDENTTMSPTITQENVVPKSVTASDGLLYISYITLPLFLVFGLCGNSLTLIVTRSKAYTSTFHGLLIAALAVIDIMYLLCFPFHKGFIIKLFGLDIRGLSKAGCSIFVTFWRTSKLCSAALVVLVCLERFALIWFPHKAKLVLNKRAAIVAISCVFIAILTFCGAWSTLADVKNGKCVGLNITPEKKHMAQVFSVIGMALHSFIPAGILLIFTPLAILKLYYQQTLRRTTGDERKNKRRNELLRASSMLLSVVIAYLLLVTPFCMARHILAIEGINISAAPFLWTKNLTEIANICEQANSVINFFLYVWLSPSFREHFRSIFGLTQRAPGTVETDNPKWKSPHWGRLTQMCLVTRPSLLLRRVHFTFKGSLVYLHFYFIFDRNSC